MLGLMKYVLCDKDDADVMMMTDFRKRIAHKATGIGAVEKVIEYEETQLTPGDFKIHWHAVVMTDVQI